MTSAGARGFIRTFGCTLAAAAMLTACGRSEKSARVDTAGTTSKPTSVSGGVTPARSLCPATGRWAQCSVEKRLKSAGLVARKIDGEQAHRAGFSVAPAVYTIGRGSRLELFIYPDDAALARDISKIDTVAVAPRGTAGSWGSPPLLIRSGNLAAVLLSADEREVERLSLALTAGAPQPAR